MMTLPRFLRVVGPSLFMILWFACGVVGQTETATVSGLVTDRTAAAVSGAEVRLQSVERGTVTTTTTNDAGIFVFASVYAGQYQVSVRKEGFKQVDLLGLIVNVQDHIEQNFRLEVGSVAESVTVEAAASTINTTDGSVSTVVDQTYVKNMPLNGRSFQDLILLTPGVVTQTPQNSTTQLGITGEFSVNGQRPESNYYSVDGVSANVGASFGDNNARAGTSGSLAASTALGTTQALISVDALQEFRVQSSSYSAEYGRNPGAQFAFETKSGTNEWHGTGYDYLRNGVFDAQDWFNNYFGKPNPALRQNDFGGTVGGPVTIPGLYNGKDKTFFFVSYEGLRLTSPQAAVASSVPDLCMRGLGPCPSGRSPAAMPVQPVVNAFPLPTPNGLADATNGVAQFIGTWSNPSSLNSTSVRFDHVLNDKLRLFFRFGDTSSTSAIRRPVSVTPPTLIVKSDYVLRTYTAGAANIFNSRLTNDFRINYSRNEVTSHNDISQIGGSSPLNLLQVTGVGPGSESLLFFILGPSFLVITNGQSPGTQRQWNVIDTVGFTSGRHQMKFGVDFRRLAPSVVPPGLLAQYGFFSEGAVESNSAGAFFRRSAPAYPLYKNFSTFAQDEWRLLQRLSLSLGLRWEVNPAPGVWRGLKAYTIQGTGPDTWTLAPQGTPLWRTTWYNIAPRLGAAYMLHNVPGWQTVVRGGGGVFFDTGQQLATMAFDGPGFTGPAAFPSVQFPGNPEALAPAIVNPPVAPFGAAVQVPSRRLQLPYTIQWNSSVEQALGASQTLTVSYIGSHARRLLRLSEYDSSINPLTSLFRIAENGLTSDYGSLQVQFRRRLSRGLTALTSYSWSHCLDYGSQNYAFGYQRGNCDFDIRHNFSAAFSYNLPNAGQNIIAKAFLHHWGVDDRFTVRSGFPVTLNGNPLVEADGLVLHAGLDLVPSQPIYLYGANCDSVLQGLGDLAPGKGCPGGRAINPQAFRNVSSGSGNAPRNFAKGFGAWQMNLAVRREFPLYERLKLQFRAEAFNVFNHPNFGTIDSGFGDQTFGQATATLANSLGVLSPLYQTGGPRSMQFALKLVF